MSEGPSAAVLAALQNNPIETDHDQLAKLHEAVAKVRDLEQLKSDQEFSLKETNKALQEQYFKTLPELLDQAGVPSITIAPEGNMPEVIAKVENYYHAVIASDWPEEAKTKAFKYLEDMGHGGLIRTTVVVTFPREEHDRAVKLAGQLSKEYDVSVDHNVHWATLTAWLKDMVEKKRILPDLETIGATVGRMCKPKLGKK